MFGVLTLNDVLVKGSHFHFTLGPQTCVGAATVAAVVVLCAAHLRLSGRDPLSPATWEGACCWVACGAGASQGPVRL